MENALIVSNSKQACDSLSDFLKMCGYRDILFYSSGSETRRKLFERNYDIIIINTPVQDEFGVELSIDIAQKTDSGVILLAKSDVVEEISSKVENYGVFVLSKPFGKQMFFQSVKLLSVSKNRLYTLQRQNKKLLQKIDDIRLIDRAKCVLIENLKMTEQQAHKYIEKQAMDMRESKREIAEGILRTYCN